VVFQADLGRYWGDVEGGVTAQISHHTSIYGSVAYQHVFGRQSEAVRGSIGVRVNW
jgi:outer membrane autotransporter protein